MRMRQLGNSGLFVSELCLGTMTFGGSEDMWGMIGQLQQEEADGLVKASLDAGINFIDTANIYALGRSRWSRTRSTTASSAFPKAAAWRSRASITARRSKSSCAIRTRRTMRDPAMPMRWPTCVRASATISARVAASSSNRRAGTHLCHWLPQIATKNNRRS